MTAVKHALLAAIVLSACSDSREIASHAMLGRWGGQGAQLIADAKRIRVIALCGQKFHAAGPLIPYKKTKRFVFSLTREPDASSQKKSEITSVFALRGEELDSNSVRLDVTGVTVGGGTFTRSYSLSRDAQTGFDTGCDYY